jgi:hypothetical protein
MSEPSAVLSVTAMVTQFNVRVHQTARGIRYNDGPDLQSEAVRRTGEDGPRRMASLKKYTLGAGRVGVENRPFLIGTLCRSFHSIPPRQNVGSKIDAAFCIEGKKIPGETNKLSGSGPRADEYDPMSTVQCISGRRQYTLLQKCWIQTIDDAVQGR